MHIRLWNRYAFAGDVFLADPTPRNEGIAISTYAEFARASCPKEADELINILCRRLAEIEEQQRNAA